jgi:hypothetical protein
MGFSEAIHRSRFDLAASCHVVADEVQVNRRDDGPAVLPVKPVTARATASNAESGALCADGGAEDRLEQSRFRSNRDLARSAGFCPRFGNVATGFAQSSL